MKWAGLEPEAKAGAGRDHGSAPSFTAPPTIYALPDRGPSPAGFYGIRGTVMYREGCPRPNPDWPPQTVGHHP